jgi:hypothetical protein
MKPLTLDLSYCPVHCCFWVCLVARETRTQALWLKGTAGASDCLDLHNFSLAPLVRRTLPCAGRVSAPARMDHGVPLAAAAEGPRPERRVQKGEPGQALQWGWRVHQPMNPGPGACSGPGGRENDNSGHSQVFASPDAIAMACRVTYSPAQLCASHKEALTLCKLSPIALTPLDWHGPKGGGTCIILEWPFPTAVSPIHILLRSRCFLGVCCSVLAWVPQAPLSRP